MNVSSPAVLVKIVVQHRILKNRNAVRDFRHKLEGYNKMTVRDRENAVDIIQFEAAIANQIFKSSYCKDDCNFFYFEDHDGEKYYQGLIPLKFEENPNVIFTVPAEGKNIFIIASVGDKKQ